jgi:hypothetical protein
VRDLGRLALIPEADAGAQGNRAVEPIGSVRD